METHALTDDIHQVLVGFIDRGERFALATVLEASGSTPAKAGTKAIIDSTGSIWGTVGGGLPEARAIQAAVEAIREARPAVLDLKLAGASADDDVPICGGNMRILLDPGAAAHRAAYAAAAAARQQRERGALVTTVRGTAPPGVSVEWFAANRISTDPAPPDAEAIASVLARETPAHFVEPSPQAGPSAETLIEPVVPTPHLVIVGGGHVGQALARQAGLVGFAITIVEDRADFARPDLFPGGATIRCGNITSILDDLGADRDTYIAIMTRGHQHDADALAACLRKPAAYLGMIGSQRKVAMIREAFLGSGLAGEAEFERVHAPIGLDIGAQTVPE
ncbi:MAG: XdhC family protein, partial [Planctomycetes bacterium]|nr:XdhC family protein [Planctomycetota bacterium]